MGKLVDQAKGYEKLINELDKYITFWVSALGLNHWKVGVEYLPIFAEEGPGTAARIHPMWEYQHAEMKVYLPALKGDTAGDKESIIVHELCHCLVNPMSVVTQKGASAAREHEEYVVSKLASAFLSLRYGKK